MARLPRSQVRVVIPLQVMSFGLHDLAAATVGVLPVQVSLAALISYIVVYLVLLTRNKPDRPTVVA